MLWRRRVVILCYHGVTPLQHDRFHRQMEYIARRTVMIDELDSFTPRWKPHVCITFDDALSNLLYTAIPTLRQLNIQATVFAPSGYLGRAAEWPMSAACPDRGIPLMKCSELRKLAEIGFDIGSHTVSHSNLSETSLYLVERELRVSKMELENNICQPIRTLALPYGAVRPELEDMARAVGYDRILSLAPRLYRRGSGDHMVGRILVSPDIWWIEYMLVCSGAYAWLDIIRHIIK